MCALSSLAGALQHKVDASHSSRVFRRTFRLFKDILPVRCTLRYASVDNLRHIAVMVEATVLSGQAEFRGSHSLEVG